LIEFRDDRVQEDTLKHLVWGNLRGIELQGHIYLRDRGAVGIERNRPRERFELTVHLECGGRGIHAKFDT
jgi:hypothetical protein